MTEKTNYWTQEQGTQNAKVAFGGLSPVDDVTSSWQVTAKDGRHFITMDEDGQRKGWTTMNAPGAFQINSGEDLLVISEGGGGRENKVEQTGMFFNCENGDVIIRARNGKIRFEALDIEMFAKGNDPEGVCWIKANEAIKLDAQNITIDGVKSVNLVSTGIVSVRSTLTNIFSGMVYGCTVATLTNFIPKVSNKIHGPKSGLPKVKNAKQILA